MKPSSILLAKCCTCGKDATWTLGGKTFCAPCSPADAKPIDIPQPRTESGAGR